jgi:abortive infection bacteriophage resistance protein
MPKSAGSSFLDRRMSYNKPPKTYPRATRNSQNRGLNVTDEASALHSLEHHNYYRLSAYRFPLTVQGNPDRFLPGITFDDLWGLYHFDRGIRQLVAEGVAGASCSQY